MHPDPSAPSRERVWTVPNILSLVRLALVPLFVVLSLRGAFAAAFFLFIGAAATDALDGWIARRFDQRTRLGSFLDPAADKTMMVTTFIIYTLPLVATTHRLPPWLTGTVFLRDITIVIFAYLLYTRVRVKRFPPTIAGKISTILQVVALVATIGANAFTAPWILPYLDVVYRATLVMTLYSGFSYIRKWDLELEGGAK
ncbi:MAG: CDP-alcohol phosphatidyltransferase family protein [Thermoanaerobaculia bacterium]